MKKAIILSNMGGARTPEELKLFLKNMFSDKRIIPGIMRYPVAALLPRFRYKKVWKEYEKIGGSSIYNITESLVKKMETFTGTPVKYSMRYTKPYLEEVISDLDEVTLVPMYPHFSTTTIGSILDEIEALNFEGKINVLPEFYKEKKFNDLIVKSILNKIRQPNEYHLIFSAHGLPEYIVKKGDPYITQVYEHVAILEKQLTDFKSVSVGFQSRLGPVSWQKPYLEDVLSQFKNEKVVIYPISFLIDNSETDFELKIEYAERAKRMGIKEYQVIECLNDQPEFAHFLTNLTQKEPLYTKES